MKNTIIMIAILIGQSLSLTAQTIQYQYDSKGNRTQQKTAGCSETPTTTQTQRIILDKGWNLISTYMQPTDYSINKVFSNILTDAIKIKNQADSFDPTVANDFNTLKTVEDGAGYLINMQRSATLEITGDYNPNNNPKITLKKGWNLIGYPFAQVQSVATAFSAILPVVEKVKSSFESYDPSIAPAFNTLSQIESGKGYWVKVKAATEFVYPQPTATGRSSQNSYVRQRKEQQEFVNWQPIVHPTSMIAYGQVTLDGQPIEGKAMISAFVAKECRATALVQNNKEQSISSMVINGLQDELIQFFLYKDGQIYQTEFTYNLSVGQTPTTLLPLAFNSAKKEVVSKKQSLTVSPNPFAEQLNITLDLPENTMVALSLYDTRGQQIATENRGQLDKGTQTVDWDLQYLLPQLTMGIYYLEIKTNQKVFTQKIVFQP